MSGQIACPRSEAAHASGSHQITRGITCGDSAGREVSCDHSMRRGYACGPPPPPRELAADPGPYVVRTVSTSDLHRVTVHLSSSRVCSAPRGPRTSIRWPVGCLNPSGDSKLLGAESLGLESAFFSDRGEGRLLVAGDRRTAEPVGSEVEQAARSTSRSAGSRTLARRSAKRSATSSPERRCGDAFGTRNATCSTICPSASGRA
jgi:hypothetical protein